MSACIVLIRRFIKPERADAFAAWFARQPPVTARGCEGKTLTRLDPGTDVPPALNGFQIAGNGSCVTFLVVERWASVADFRAYVPKASTNDQDEFETMPRQRVILTVV